MKLATVICFIFLGFCQNLKGENPSMSNDLPDYLINVSISSIQDMLSSGIDVNDKIEKKIINLTSVLFHNEFGFSAIKWNNSDSFMVKKSIPVDVGSAKVLFHDFSVHCDALEYHSKRLSTAVTCNTQTNITFEVNLPKKITVNADVLIIQPYSSDVQGSISIVLENAKIVKNFEITSNESNPAVRSSNIYYDNSEIHLRIEKKFQKLIYDESQTMLDKAESLLEQFFVNQLNKEFENFKNTLQSTCSMEIRPNKEQNKKPPDSLNTWYLKGIYVIPSSTSEWKGVKLTIGPIIIDGLSYFNNTGPSILETEDISYHDSYHIDPIQRNVRLRSGPLRGKLELKFDTQEDNSQDDTNSASIYTFLIDYVQFESVFQRIRHPDDYYRRDSDYYELNKINLNFGTTLTKLLDPNGTCVRRNQFIDNVISENLKSVIKNSFLKSVKKTWHAIGKSDGYSLNVGE